MNKKIIYFAPLAALLILIVIIVISITDSIQKQQIMSGNFSDKKIAFPEMKLPNLLTSGEFISNSIFSKKYILINVFASWCTTCAAEHQTLLDLKNEGIIDIYGIAWNDLDINAAKFLKERGNPYKYVAIDNKGFLADKLGVKGVPESFLIDPNGFILTRIYGNIDKNFIKSLKNLQLN